jgi:Ca2+-transporting ATPase
MNTPLNHAGYHIDAPHALDTPAVLDALSTSAEGLNSQEATQRLELFGYNRLEEAAKVPAWKKFFGQFANLLTGILIVAAIVSLVVARDVKTPVVVFIVVLMNAVIGFIQENKAEASLESLKKMLSTQARVKRDNSLQNIAATEIVVGDIVALEAGDRVPADGRIIEASNLEIQESALTGESSPVAKTSEVVSAETALADRKSMAYMNSSVTRGRAELVVTATGMKTEIGRIAELLSETSVEKSPLQRQLDQLAHSLAKLAGIIVGLVFLIGIISGDDLGDLFLTSVALAVAAIPEGLPAVTAVTLAIGVSKLAHQNAIVKRLASVETLGCTSVICSDKTGTLTLNEMTAQEVVLQQEIFEITGEGYSPNGQIRSRNSVGMSLPSEVLEPLALCNDSVVHQLEDGQWSLVGDPTEGALTTIVMKAGQSPTDIRQAFPRVGEIPFDSAHKFMATFHRVRLNGGEEVVRMYVKGAPDVLMAKSHKVYNPSGSDTDLAPLVEEFHQHNHRLGTHGLRVLAVARKDIPLQTWDSSTQDSFDHYVAELTLVALIGIIDPPRPEARVAIQKAKDAGIAVKMITGDHAVTAAAIGASIGLDGKAMNGTDLDSLNDQQLDEVVTSTSIFARVSPEHKIRLVDALQKQSRVVAMTGDGVNDAPALKKADIGVAMGITGTEVTKEAATMVLTDDNFATIVTAVERGRVIYDNIVKFVRFQLSTTLGFSVVFLFASLFDIAGRKPFTAIAILWVNIIMDGPPAMALGVDKAQDGVMKRHPRPIDEPILTRSRWISISLAAFVMAVGTLLVFVMAPGPDTKAGVASIAGTMGFNTFVLFQFFNILNVRSEEQSAFSRLTFSNKTLWASLIAVITLQVGVTHLSFMQSIFDTTSLNLNQWLVCIGAASSILWIEEIRKLVRRAMKKKALSTNER